MGQFRSDLLFFLIGLLAAGCDGFMMYGFGLWTTTCGKYCLNGFNGLWPDWMGLKGLSVGLAKCGFGSQDFCCIFSLGHKRQNGQSMLIRLHDGAEKNIYAFWQQWKMEHGKVVWWIHLGCTVFALAFLEHKVFIN